MKTIITTTVLLIAFGLNTSAIDLKPSRLQLEFEKLKFENNQFLLQNDFADNGKNNSAVNDNNSKRNIYTKKSPTKAFVMSLIVPGLGQYYIGDKKRAMVFAGADLISWVLYFKWDGQGNDLTDRYEAFSQEP